MQTIFSKNVSGMADQSRLRLILKFKGKNWEQQEKVTFQLSFFEGITCLAI